MLQEDSIKRIRTTMVGSIALIETVFSNELENADFRIKFEEIRKGIFDLGNKQIRL